MYGDFKSQGQSWCIIPAGVLILIKYTDQYRIRGLFHMVWATFANKGDIKWSEQDKW